MEFETAIAGWETVGVVDPKSLKNARVEAHWAAQIIGGTGEAVVPAEPDFSHTSMEWLNEHRVLAGQLTAERARVGLRLADMSLIVLKKDEVAASLQLAGKTLADALGWTIAELEMIHGSFETKPAIPTYEMPEHPVGNGAAFGPPDSAALEELARYCANAFRFESIVGNRTLGASPVRCWPHHFDIATLITLDPPGTDPEDARSIGFGMSPGDASYDEPYFYINPWPFPETRDSNPELEGGGHWHTEGWFGAVLPASSISDVSADKQGRQVYAYIRSAFAADRAILEAL